MAEMKWFKVASGIFQDDKILLIESMPDHDAILVIWFKLLALASRQNQGGRFVMSNGRPYTDEMLRTLIGRPLNTTRLALKTFEEFGMVSIEEGETICLSNWRKYQNYVDSTEYERLKKQAYRERKKQALLEEKRMSTDMSGTSPRMSTEKNEKKEEEKEKEIEKESTEETPARKKEKPQKHQHGKFKNVLLTDEELEKLREKFPDTYEAMIDRLSYGIESKGYKYKSHYATILNWYRRDAEEKEQRQHERARVTTVFDYDPDELPF